MRASGSAVTRDVVQSSLRALYALVVQCERA